MIIKCTQKRTLDGYILYHSTFLGDLNFLEPISAEFFKVKARNFCLMILSDFHNVLCYNKRCPIMKGK
jgi:beta-galactosidase beta subunit